MTADTPGTGNDDLQFERAEAGGAGPSGPVCALCQKPIAAYYWEAGGQTVCSSCKNKVQASNVTGVAAGKFLRATSFGFLGALAGAGVYYGVLATTGYEVGLIAIVVGFIVGYAVRMGAGGRGGRRYQILALSLTYLAIGGTYVPLAMREISNEADTAADSTLAAAQADSTAAARAGDPPVTQRDLPGDSVTATATQISPVLALAALAALAAAMPILVVIVGFPQSLISALIIGFALHQAWRMNGRVKVTFTGPFKVGAAPRAGGAAGA